MQFRTSPAARYEKHQEEAGKVPARLFCVRNTYQNSEVNVDAWLHRCDGVYKKPGELKGHQMTVFGQIVTWASQKVYPSICPQCKKEGY